MPRSLFMKLCLLGFIACLTLPFTVAQADDKAPTAAVEKFHNTLIDNMKNGKALGFEGRKAKLLPVVNAVFDMQAMARISSGGGWAKMPEADQAAVIAAFTDFTVANYAANFDAYDGEAFVTKDQTAADAKGNLLVNTKLALKGMPPVLFNYRIHDVGGSWKIFDIYLEGAISQLAMRRAEFSVVLARGGATELIAHLKKLAAEAKKDNG